MPGLKETDRTAPQEHTVRGIPRVDLDNRDVASELKERAPLFTKDSPADALLQISPRSAEDRIRRAQSVLHNLGVSIARDGQGNYTVSLESRVIGRLIDARTDEQLAADLESVARVAIERHLRRVQTIPQTAEGQRWSSRQQEVSRLSVSNDPSGRLLNVSRFISPECRQALQQFEGQRVNGAAFRTLNPEQSDGYRFAIEQEPGQRWYLTESPWFRDQYPNGKPFEKTELVLRSAEDPNMLIAFPAAAVFSGNKIDFAKLQDLMKEAQRNRASEVEHGASLARLDLERLPIGYVGLVDPNVRGDPIISGLALDVSSFPELMNGLKDSQGQARYNFVTAGGPVAIPVNSSPAELLENQLNDLYRRGIRSFYINVAGHGDSAGVHFMSANGHLVLKGEELTALFNKFPDCTFVVDTLACQGGGLADAIRDYRDPSGQRGRILVKLQSKPSANNQEGRVLGQDGKPEPFSSYYNLFFNHYIREYPYGEAHRRADLEVKQRVGCDAELWISGPQGGAAVKGL